MCYNKNHDDDNNDDNDCSELRRQQTTAAATAKITTMGSRPKAEGLQGICRRHLISVMDMRLDFGQL